jgi:hypothetical protein
MTEEVLVVALTRQRDLTDIEKVFARQKLFATRFKKRNEMERFSAEMTALMLERKLKGSRLN